MYKFIKSDLNNKVLIKGDKRVLKILFFKKIQ